jgi:putative hemolysin
MVVVIVVLIAVTALFALSETALTRMSRHKAMALVEEGRKGAVRLLRLAEHTERVLPVVLFALEITTLVAATLVGIVTEHVFGAVGVVVGVAFEIVILFVVAELAPKTWAVQHPERAALFSAPVVAALVSFAPLRLATRGLIKVSNQLLPGVGIKEGPYVSEEELRAMADTAADEDVIERDERTLIHSIIDFGDTVVREVMVPRTDMVAVESRSRVEDVIDVAIAAGYSRIPVFAQGIDDIVGVVYAKDLLRAEREGRQGEVISSLQREAQFTPESKRVSELMREMQASKQHMAMVVDEYGGTAGLVTLEDLLEEIVGEIVDEYDNEEPTVQRLADGSLRVNARMSIDEVNELIDGELPEGDWDSVGGLVYSALGHVPVEGEAVDVEGHLLTAERVQGRRISRVRIITKAPVDGPVEA